MPTYIDTFNTLVAIGTIGLQLFCFVIVGALLFFKKKENVFLKFLHDYTFIIGFLASFGAIAMSLFYSNVIGFPACELCWMQRIFIYPQAVLFGMELYRREKVIVDYSLVLAFIGTLISLFHIYVEHGGASSLSCATGTATEISCATRYVYEFNYISIPVMAFSFGVFMMLLLWNYRYMSKK